MESIKQLFAANIACLMFLGFTIYCLSTEHLYFAVAGFIVAVSGAKMPKSDNE